MNFVLKFLPKICALWFANRGKRASVSNITAVKPICEHLERSASCHLMSSLSLRLVHTRQADTNKKIEVVATECFFQISK